MWDQFKRLSSWRQVAVTIGVCLIVLGLSCIAAIVTGTFPSAKVAFLARLDIRTVAGIAITGCLCAAIGYWET